MSKVTLTDIYVYVLNARHEPEHDLSSKAGNPAAKCLILRNRPLGGSALTPQERLDCLFDVDIDTRYLDLARREIRKPEHTRVDGRRRLITRDKLLEILDPLVNPQCYQAAEL